MSTPLAARKRRRLNVGPETGAGTVPGTGVVCRSVMTFLRVGGGSVWGSAVALRVEGVAEAVAGEVEPDRGDEDDQARDDRVPPGA
ncbi:hypothetical protein Ssi03_40900 [Sphaerisporangium siamense]|nr:hypothetical protein Ssi03_40900 [Sphaerisporangium siamense]